MVKVPVTGKPQMTGIAGAGITRVVVPQEPGRGMLEVYSVPSGAAVTVSGAGSASGTTPAKFSLYAGTYTVKVSLAGYSDYSATFALAEGAIMQVDASLKKSTVIPLPAMVQKTIAPVQADSLTAGPGIATRTTTLSAPPPEVSLSTITGIRTITTPVPATWACPDAGWSCLTMEEASQMFGYPNARYGDQPCGYTPAGNEYLLKYCYQDVDAGGSLSRSVLAAGGIRDGDDIYIRNETGEVHGVVKKPVPAGAAVSAGPLDAVFHFVNSILGGSAKPESRLDIVGFNPQPEPPGKEMIGGEAGNAPDAVSLNPQPEPPAQDPVAGAVQ